MTRLKIAKGFFFFQVFRIASTCLVVLLLSQIYFVLHLSPPPLLSTIKEVDGGAGGLVQMGLAKRDWQNGVREDTYEEEGEDG